MYVIFYAIFELDRKRYKYFTMFHIYIFIGHVVLCHALLHLDAYYYIKDFISRYNDYESSYSFMLCSTTFNNKKSNKSHDTETIANCAMMSRL